ncbi:hypothetical protein A1O7_01025 [Cladophialophora yegresii CBS 114405]|uniref:N-acetyltransferase domain-containing protein n=1 Tax=Cladophialophora yegresii CBS 114405 TaxID=1182544 RepID=W9W995_9EURO|nr:uncharacterized protein A1O7_01025 [Cladophialophora yegresii CBS 114405]EXJ64687.1 hypothetical protein A1O7_01025 [Cladophialophora yegresii CBS 114405]
MEPLSLLPGSEVAVKPITSEADLPFCARLADRAVKPDPFHEFKARYSSQNVYEETLQKLTESLRDDRGKYCLLKAVVPASSRSGADDAEIIVGFAQWRRGYVEVPKMDPFATRKAPETNTSLDIGIPCVASAEAKEHGTPGADTTDLGSVAGAKVQNPRKTQPFYSNPHDELARKLMNTYIGTMRGKRHVYLHRLIVDPSYQRQGIGQKLLNWGIETADRENIGAWLFCRPAGYKLYERNGWKALLTTEVDVPDEDLIVPPVVVMLRPPAGHGG